MRVILGADPHGTGRTPEELHYSIEVFRDAYKLAEKHNAMGVAWLGDLLHFKYGLELSLLLAWSEIIKEYQAKGIATVAIPGNHDKPWEDKPDLVAIDLLPGHIYTQPQMMVLDGVLLAFLPWFPAAEYKHKAAELAAEAKKFPGLKFLLSHTPLAEGTVSASNIQVEQPIRIADLHVDVWDQVFLGDYHAAQTLGPKIRYLGAPRPTIFGDRGCVGYWLFEAAHASWNVTPLPLPGTYPEFIKVSIGPFGPPLIPNYRKINKYIVRCSPNWVVEMSGKYRDGNVQIVNDDPNFKIAAPVKLTRDDRATPFATFLAWLKMTNRDPGIFYPIGEEALRECLRGIY